MADPKETLPLAVEIADLIADAGEKHESLDIKREAKRLVHEHPEAELPVNVVAEFWRRKPKRRAPRSHCRAPRQTNKHGGFDEPGAE